MPQGDSPEIAPETRQAGVPRRSVPFLRGAVAALRLAGSTVAGVIGATLALLPAVPAAGPVGREASPSPSAKPTGESSRAASPG